MKLFAFFALLLGLLGLLLCLGGIAGAFFVKGTVLEHVDAGHEAVDAVLDGLQDGIADAIPRVKSARQRVAVQTAEKIMPEMAHLRTRLEGVARMGEAAAEVLEALDRDGVLLAELRAHLRELEGAARDLIDRPEKREPVLDLAEKHLEEVHASLSNLRLEAADLRNHLTRLVWLATLAISAFCLWMGLGQWCLTQCARGDSE